MIDLNDVEPLELSYDDLTEEGKLELAAAAILGGLAEVFELVLENACGVEALLRARRGKRCGRSLPD